MPQAVIRIQRTCLNHVTIQGKTFFFVERNWLTLLWKTEHVRSSHVNANEKMNPISRIHQ